MPSKYQLLIFDWDGTLADSIGRIVEAMNRSAVACGYLERDEAAIKGIIGLSLAEAISVLYPALDEQQVAAFRQQYADVYKALDVEPSPLFPGVRESLQAFREQGYKLAVATGKARRGLDRVLQSNGWAEFFDITRAADEAQGKPHPLMLEQILAHCQVTADQALMIGDSAFDLQMATNAGIDSVAVGYGALPLSALRAFKPTLAIERFSELGQWLDDPQPGQSLPLQA